MQKYHFILNFVSCSYLSIICFRQRCCFVSSPIFKLEKFLQRILSKHVWRKVFYKFAMYQSIRFEDLVLVLDVKFIQTCLETSNLQVCNVSVDKLWRSSSCHWGWIYRMPKWTSLIQVSYFYDRWSGWVKWISYHLMYFLLFILIIGSLINHLCYESATNEHLLQCVFFIMKNRILTNENNRSTITKMLTGKTKQMVDDKSYKTLKISLVQLLEPCIM